MDRQMSGCVDGRGITEQENEGLCLCVFLPVSAFLYKLVQAGVKAQVKEK